MFKIPEVEQPISRIDRLYAGKEIKEVEMKPEQTYDLGHVIDTSEPLSIGIGWQSCDCMYSDFDACALGYDKDDAFINHHKGLEGVNHSGDSLSGSGGKDKDDEVLTFKFDKIHESVDKIYITVTVFSVCCLPYPFTSMLAAPELHCRIQGNIKERGERTTFARFQCGGKMEEENSLKCWDRATSNCFVLGCLYRTRGGFSFYSIGKPVCIVCVPLLTCNVAEICLTDHAMLQYPPPENRNPEFNEKEYFTEKKEGTDASTADIQVEVGEVTGLTGSIERIER